MLIHYGSYLTKRLFLRSKKNKILDTLKYLAHRLFYKKKCHNHRYSRINIRGNKTQVCMQQSSLYRKCYSNSHTAYYVKLPHIQLRFNSCRLIFLTVMTKYRIHIQEIRIPLCSPHLPHVHHETTALYSQP